MNKYATYPVGHPVIITTDFDDDYSKYFGLAKVKCLALRKLFHPVLPLVSNGKLKFPLCKKCADAENRAECKSMDDDRAFFGTWCTPESELARTKGYTILEVNEVYNFPETTQYDKFTGNGGILQDTSTYF